MTATGGAGAGHGDFADVMAANAAYAETFDLAGLAPVAARGLAVVTCMDSRVEPLAMLGIAPGDAKIMRNAGARVTDDVLRTLVLANHLLGVDRILVVAHSDCKMSSATDEEVEAAILSASGIDARSLEFALVADQRATLLHDVQKVRSWPFLTPGIPVGGFIYDVGTGLLTQVT
jgi:carbonic anhydrase